MPRYEHNTVINQFARYRHGLLGITGVVGNQQPNLLPEHTALRVDIRDGHFGTMLNLLTPENIRSSERTDSGDENFSLRRNQVERDHGYTYET